MKQSGCQWTPIASTTLPSTTTFSHPAQVESPKASDLIPNVDVGLVIGLDVVVDNGSDGINGDFEGSGGGGGLDIGKTICWLLFGMKGSGGLWGSDLECDVLIGGVGGKGGKEYCWVWLILGIIDEGIVWEFMSVLFTFEFVGGEGSFFLLFVDALVKL